VRDVGAILDPAEPFEDPDGGIARRGEVLPDADRAGRAVAGDEIREGAADIDAYEIPGQGRLPGGVFDSRAAPLSLSAGDDCSARECRDKAP
jgi:hypothetical protein